MTRPVWLPVEEPNRCWNCHAQLEEDTLLSETKALIIRLCDLLGISALIRLLSRCFRRRSQHHHRPTSPSHLRRPPRNAISELEKQSLIPTYHDNLDLLDPDPSPSSSTNHSHPIPTPRPTPQPQTFTDKISASLSDILTAARASYPTHPLPTRLRSPPGTGRTSLSTLPRYSADAPPSYRSSGEVLRQGRRGPERRSVEVEASGPVVDWSAVRGQRRGGIELRDGSRAGSADGSRDGWTLDGSSVLSLNSRPSLETLRSWDR